MALHLSRQFFSSPPSPPSISRGRRLTVSCSASFSHHPKIRRPYTSVMIVPTGIGASIGGYAGDALPVARTLASVVDCLISHPNVLNAAMLYWPMPNTLYVEGYALDRFAEGSWALQPVHQNKVGLVLDAGLEEELRIRHLQVVDATRASIGLPVVDYIVTDTPLEVEIWVDPKCGKSTGRIKHPDSLLRAVHTLINQSKVNAVAVVGRFPDDDAEDVEDYRQGKGIDLLAGVEAVISHLVVKQFQIPCAHAPALSPLPLSSSLSPRSAAEEIGYTFLPCVLAGLSHAPQYVVRNNGDVEAAFILANDVDSVILPIDACGGDAALAFSRSLVKNKPLVVAVQENETVMDDTPDKLGIEAHLHVEEIPPPLILERWTKNAKCGLAPLSNYVSHNETEMRRRYRDMSDLGNNVFCKASKSDVEYSEIMQWLIDRFHKLSNSSTEDTIEDIKEEVELSDQSDNMYNGK